MTASTWQPTYIYIKEIRLHNNKREKSGQSLLVERFSYFDKTPWLVYMLVALPTNPYAVYFSWRLHICPPVLKW